MKTDMQQYLKTAGSEADLPTGGAPVVEAAAPVAVAAATATAPGTTQQTERAEKIRAALGGASNIRKLEPLAATRLRIVLADASGLDAVALRAAGVPATQFLANGEVDLIVGLDAEKLAGAMR